MSTSNRIDITTLTPAERQELLQALQAADGQQSSATPKRRALDLSEATPERFVAQLADGPDVRVKDYVGHRIVATGHNNAKGPKGGTYFRGEAVVETQPGQWRKGVLQISKQAFDILKGGGQAPAWVEFDGASKSLLVGVMTGYRAKAPKTTTTA